MGRFHMSSMAGAAALAISALAGGVVMYEEILAALNTYVVLSLFAIVWAGMVVPGACTEVSAGRRML